MVCVGAQAAATVTQESFARAADLAAGLGDEKLMRAAWS